MPQASHTLLIGTLCYFCAALLWGLNLPLTAALLKHFDPFWVSPCRYLVASMVLALLLSLSMGPAQLRSPILLARVLWLSLPVALFLVFYNVGLSYSHPITVAAISAGSPVIVAITSRVMTGSRLEKGFWGATLLTLIGAGIAIVGRANSTSEGAGFKGGEILIVFSLASWTVYSILAQRWFSTEVSALRRTYLSSLGAVPWLLRFWAIARVAGLVGEPNLSPSPQGWALLVAGAVFSTALATVAWNMGVARLGVQTGGMWQNAVPVFAVLISLIFFGVEPRAEQILGGMLVMAGVLYMQWHKLRAK